MEIQCKDLSFSYENKNIFSGLNLTVQSREHLWIKGPSGSGKSTFLKVLAGLLPAASGAIHFNNSALSDFTANQRMQFRFDNIGYIHQENHLIDHWTVEQNLNLISDVKNKESIFKKLNLDILLMKTLAQNLSGGERQRVNIAKLILRKPKLALIDEPTSHLDDENTNHAMKLIKSELRESTLILISHDSRIEQYKLKPINFVEIKK